MFIDADRCNVAHAKGRYAGRLLIAPPTDPAHSAPSGADRIFINSTNGGAAAFNCLESERGVTIHSRAGLQSDRCLTRIAALLRTYDHAPSPSSPREYYYG